MVIQYSFKFNNFDMETWECEIRDVHSDIEMKVIMKCQNFISSYESNFFGITKDMVMKGIIKDNEIINVTEVICTLGGMNENKIK